MEQDIRIIELINWSTIPCGSLGEGVHSAITYYDQIVTHKVQETGTHALISAYNNMKEQLEFRSKGTQKHGEKDCRVESQQTLIAFTGLGNEELDFNEDSIQQFWGDTQSPLLFMTMVNLPLGIDLKKVIKHIREIFSETNFLIYFTFEYSEILIFFKGNSPKDYCKRIMTLCFCQNKEPVLDTITACAFNNSFTEIAKENITLCVELGVKDYPAAKKYLSNHGIDSSELKWLLGRNDIGFLKNDHGLKWLRDFYNDRMKCEICFEWLSTYSFSFMVPCGEEEFVSPPPPEAPRSSFSKKIATITELYKDECSRLRFSYNDVFVRFLFQLGRLIDNVSEKRMAEDLVVCLFQEVDDFLEYLKKVLQAKKLAEKDESDLQKTINSFYINILALINSTVHNTQEFIQIPHCASPQFEMPSKLMAFYELAVNRIIAAFKDEDNLYGAILSPKLVDELEVESLAVAGLPIHDQLLNVSLGEQALYELQNTFHILGHEMAHFVGEVTRNRKERAECFFAFCIYDLLTNLYDSFVEFFPKSEKKHLEESLNIEAVLSLAQVLSKDFSEVHNRKRNGGLYRRELVELSRELSGEIFHNPENRKKIFDDIILPLVKEKSFQSLLSTRWQVKGYQGLENYSFTLLNRFFDEAIFITEAKSRPLRRLTLFREYSDYLFAETYADVAMIMLFKISLNEYFHIFVKGFQGCFQGGNQEDSIELTRFTCVVRSLLKCGFWSSPTVKSSSKKEDSWELILFTTAQLLISFDSEKSCQEEFLNFCTQQEIDIALITVIVEYLDSCVKSLENHFNNNFDKVNLVRTMDSETNVDDLRELLEKIRDYEKAYLDEIQAKE